LTFLAGESAETVYLHPNRPKKGMMNHVLKVAVALVLVCHPAQAQLRVPGGLPPGFPHAMLDVLGSRPSFYGKATVVVANGTDGDSSSFDCNVAVLAGNMRLEANSFQGGSNLPPTDAAQLSQMHTITVCRPDKNRMYLIYPRFKSYLEVTYGPNTGTAPVALPTIVKTPLPKETIDDHPCDRAQWSVTEANGEHYDLAVWSATDAGNFPIQIKLLAPPTLVKFQNVQFQPPDSTLFEVPTGYAVYEGIQELILKNAAASQTTNSP
jgi:hypothetical protein